MINPFAKAAFKASIYELDKLPPSQGEIAFAGRSNAGKSSALNVIVGQHVARESKTPGRTQAINVFTLDHGMAIVDLPGYGYAKVPPALRRQWDGLLSGYLQTRSELRGMALVMDSRHPLQPLDRQMLGWFQPTGLPVHILLTKADKLTRNEAAKAIAFMRSELRDVPSVSVQLFSAHAHTGIDEAVTTLAAWLK